MTYRTLEDGRLTEDSPTADGLEDVTLEFAVHDLAMARFNQIHSSLPVTWLLPGGGPLAFRLLSELRARQFLVEVGKGLE